VSARLYGSTMPPTKDDSAGAVLYRHFHRFMASPNVAGKEGGKWVDLAWGTARAEGASYTQFFVALVEAYLREKQRELLR